MIARTADAGDGADDAAGDENLPLVHDPSASRDTSSILVPPRAPRAPHVPGPRCCASHLAVQRRPVQAQDVRGLLLVPVRPLQRLQDRHLLDLRQRVVRRHRELGFGDGLVADRSRASRGCTSGALATSTARSIAFSSSRTLPGHRLRISK